MMHFWHSGECGDIIYALKFIKDIGGGTLSIRQMNKHNIDQWQTLKHLIEVQPYVRALSCEPSPKAGMFDLRTIVTAYAATAKSPKIITCYYKEFGANLVYGPWLEHVSPKDGTYSVVNRTFRYRDPNFLWGSVLPAGEMRFLGTPEEYRNFVDHLVHTGYSDAAKRVSYHPTETLLDAAEHIAGASAFYGNASACLAIAQGVNKPCYVEVDSITGNTCLFGHERVLNYDSVQ
jgi:hypothetical protein